MKKMKKLTALTLAALMAFSLAACSNASSTASSSSSASSAATSEAASDSAQIPNPWTDCDTAEEAAQKAGFDFTVPDAVDGYSDRLLRVMEDGIYEVQYLNGSDQLCLRKAKGSDDISGDYNTYAEESSVEIDGRTVTMQGNDGQVMLATWQDGDYTYSVGCYREDGNGLTADEMTALIGEIG